MKSKLNDAELIAEAYSNVEPLEVQEEMIGALAGGLAKGAGAVAKGVGAVAKGTGKALTSAPAKKIYKGAGKAVKKTAETVGGAALGAVGGVADGAAKAVGGVVQGAVEGTVGAVQGAIDGATGGIGKAARGAVGMEDGEHEGAEHDAPQEVDMSQNPEPESLEVKKEEPAALAIVAPSIQPSLEGERVNHEDDSEVKMALAELYKIEKYAYALGLMMKETKALEGWTAAKITKAADYLGSVFHKLDYDFHADAEDHSDIAPEDHESH